MSALSKVNSRTILSQISAEYRPRIDLAEAAARWCEATQGGVPLDDALTRLVRALGAEAAILIRVRGNRVIKVAVADIALRKAVRPLADSFGEGQFGGDLARSKPGTVWLASSDSLPKGDADPALEDWQALRGLHDFAVIALVSSMASSDRIELHFPHVLQPCDLAVLSGIAPTLARTWALRRTGLVTMSGLPETRHHDPAASAPLLGFANPARLSRAEFRVCLLLSRGLSVAGVCTELGLCEATVRAHLRNIYAKTGARNMTQLVYRLASSAGRGPDYALTA